MKTLVVYYSRTGNSQLIADKIAGLLGAPTDRIIRETDYSGRLGFARGIVHSLTDKKIEIEKAAISPAGYDLVVLGGPVWVGRVACPVRSYLRRHRSELQAVAFFVTCGGSAGGSLAQMEAIYGEHPAAALSLSSPELSDGSYENAIRAFANEIKQAAGSEDMHHV
jgi:flavodoxin